MTARKRELRGVLISLVTLALVGGVIGAYLKSRSPASPARDTKLGVTGSTGATGPMGLTGAGIPAHGTKLGATGTVGATGAAGPAGAGDVGGSFRTGLVLRAMPAAGQTITPAQISLAIQIMRARARKLGIVGFRVRTTAKDKVNPLGLISIDIPASLQASQESLREKMLEEIAATDDLQFFDLEVSLATPSIEGNVPHPRALFPLLKAVAGEVKAAGATYYYLFDKKHKLVGGPAGTKTDLLALAAQRFRSRHPGDVILGVPKGIALVSCDLETSDFCPGTNGGFTPKKGQTWYYLFKLPAAMTATDINRRGTRVDYGGPGNGPIVDLRFSKHGNQKFRQITSAEYDRGQRAGSDQHFAVVLDGKLITAPAIEHTDNQLQGGIDPSINGAYI